MDEVTVVKVAVQAVDTTVKVVKVAVEVAIVTGGRAAMRRLAGVVRRRAVK
jgi:hypothetical protein